MDDQKVARGAAPSHIAYSVRETGREGAENTNSTQREAYFNRIGSAFAHKDGQGFTVVLDAMPVDGKVTLRTLKERVQAMKDGNDRTRHDKAHDRNRAHDKSRDQDHDW